MITEKQNKFEKIKSLEIYIKDKIFPNFVQIYKDWSRKQIFFSISQNKILKEKKLFSNLKNREFDLERIYYISDVPTRNENSVTNKNNNSLAESYIDELDFIPNEEIKAFFLDNNKPPALKRQDSFNFLSFLNRKEE